MLDYANKKLYKFLQIYKFINCYLINECVCAQTFYILTSVKIEKKYVHVWFSSTITHTLLFVFLSAIKLVSEEQIISFL